MFGLPIVFANPLLLGALITLPLIWYLLRLTPPRPRSEPFPPFKILQQLVSREQTPAQSPWWLTLLRLVLCSALIAALAAPVWKPDKALLTSEGTILVLIDDGWASGPISQDQIAVARQLLNDVSGNSRSVIVVKSASADGEAAGIVSNEQAIGQLLGSSNLPLQVDHSNAVSTISKTLERIEVSSIVWLSDGLRHTGTKELIELLADTELDQVLVIHPDTNKLVALDSIANNPEALVGRLTRASSSAAWNFEVNGYDDQARVVATQMVELAEDQFAADFQFSEPIELRNEIVRLAVRNFNTAGSVQLLDESNRRRLVGLITGQSNDLAQPLLSPLFYISRALQPFSDIRAADDANLSTAIPDLIDQRVSVMVLADIGTLPEDAGRKLNNWVAEGGMLIRFAGPRLASATNNELLPVELRHGDRAFGGALTWEQPKPVAPFELESPFYGLEAPHEVVVNRQVLALQETGLQQKTWARLEDGTPLVTAERRDKGWIILFHVSSDATWSNLPISGTFVEMLRRIVDLSRSNIRTTSNSDGDIRLPPLQVLNGTGSLVLPGLQALPISVKDGKLPAVGIDNPPGFYGSDQGVVALNLFDKPASLTALDVDGLPSGFIRSEYRLGEVTDLQPYLFVLAAVLLILDCLVVLWMAGTLPIRGISARGVGIVLLAGLMVSMGEPTRPKAQTSSSDVVDFSAALNTRIAWVKSGVRSVDETTAAGLRGLSRYIALRTALEPGPAAPVDIETDELAFYSLIYWPIHRHSPLPDTATMARVDAFMKQGGSVLFDTRDQASGILSGSYTPEAEYLQIMLSSLDIPPLEVTPSNHVLTKAFYLLNTFPGRYSGGELWVEAQAKRNSDDFRPALTGDGVSSILITSNDLAAAWAVDEDFRPLFPTVPPDPGQREQAFRVGVNLMMYVLTGNYKSDQVHIPALLERLGQ